LSVSMQGGHLDGVCTSNEASILCFVPWEFLLIFVAFHLLSKGFIFFLADGIKGFMFATHFPDTWTDGWERADVSRRYDQSRRHPLTTAPDRFSPPPIATSNFHPSFNPKPRKITSHAQLHLLMLLFILGLFRIGILVPCHHCFS
jgi:hypothetical protein